MALYTVTTTTGTGAGSLWQAIYDANLTAANDEIVFSSSVFLAGVGATISLTEALPSIVNTSAGGSLSITGTINATPIINANQGNFSIFKVNAGGNLTIFGVTVTGANLTGSGGAFNNSGTLNIYSSTISGNSVTGNGGGIYNSKSGTITVNNSTLSGNTSSSYGGGIFNSKGGTITVANSTLDNNKAQHGGGIINAGSLTISNSTLSANTATKSGGGIGIGTDSNVVITNCTISGNSANSGGGLYNGGNLQIANTIIANSSKGGDYSGSGNISTNLNNLVEDGTLNNNSWPSLGSGNISGDPQLNSLDIYGGGLTKTMMLAGGSPAIAKGDATVRNAAPIFGLDQRGFTRSPTTPSIGAYENYGDNIPSRPTITSVSPNVGSPAGGATITINGANLAGATSVTIGGSFANFTVVSPTSITATTPAHTAGAVSIQVTTAGGTNDANTLYSYKPTVTPSTNNLAINATTLTITGIGFDPIAANNTVSLSSGTGTVTSATATQLTVTLNTAPTLGTLGVVVSTNGTSSGDEVPAANIVNAPVITSISPAAGPKGGGNVIIIKGLNFDNNNLTGVTIGGIAATNVTVNDGPVNSKYITATIPAGVFGPANVLVTTIDGTNSTTANSIFNYTSGSFDAPAEPFSPAFPHAISINAPGSIVVTSASFTVTFNQPVTGVDAADFTLSTTGTVAGGTISSITGSGATRTVNVTGITGAGTLGLNIVDSPTITALPAFAAQATVATGSKPASVILGDVNGDGELDIITANYNSANVSVLLGNGTGTFKAQQTFATGTQPFSVKLGDMNGDGSVDIITANKGSSNASVLLGNGDGTFAAQTTFATGKSPRSVALGDVNGDGTLDIITANQGDSNVSVLLGTGNGSFAGQAVDTLNAAQSYSVALGDVNGDGKLDIVAGNRSGSVGSLLLGNGDGTFQASNVFTVGNPQVFVALGDVNGDGKLDIVAAKAGNDVSVLLGNGNGTFQGPINSTPGTNPRSATLRDVNGDGKLDLLTANYGSTNASVLLGNGNGTFQGAITFATGTNSRSATLGDVNGDGRLDIIAANFNSDNASVILGTGGSAIFATFSPQQTFATGNGAQSHALGDLNGDGKLDMVTGNLVDDTASVLLGNGNGTFKDQTTVATGDSPRAVALGDLNDDGRLDIITANRDSSTASVLLGNGNGTFQTPATFATGAGPLSVALSDVNGDGKLDLITSNGGTDSASVLLGNGNGTFQTPATFATGAGPLSVALGDVNSDGKLDIITANNGDASVSVLLGNGNGTFAAQPTLAAGSNPRSVTVGDVNGDGKLDIITANFADNSVSVLLGNGNGTFQSQQTYATGGAPYCVTLGDVNGDGDLDIITSNIFSANVSVLLGNGNGTFAAEVIFAAGDGPLSIVLGDLNGDGRLDITTANSSSGNASVLLNSLAFTGQTATVDAIAPTAPTITSITDNAATITGTIAPGGFTNDTSLDLTGTAEAASTVDIYNGSDHLGTTTANGTGAWSFTATGLVGGTYAFNATATDAPGNVSPASSPNYSVTVDTTAPAAPSITSITDDVTPITGTIAPGGFTNDTSLDLTGIAEAGSTVSIYNGSTLLNTTTADTTTGAWSYTASGLTNGATYAFNATATDAAGNVSNASTPQQTFTTEPGPISVTLGDVNGDDKLDIITANFNSANVSVLLGNGNGTFQTQTNFSTGTRPGSVALGDVNDDGRLDIITANRDSNNASVLLGNGNGTFQTQTTFSTGTSPRSVALSDVNGDGRLDIITANIGNANASVLLGNGNATFQAQASFATGDSPYSVALGDVNGDGILDIITANLGSDNASVLLGNGNGTFGPNIDFSTGSGSYPVSVILGDVNDDGRLDIITANFNSANVSVLLGNGNGTFQSQQTYATGGGPFCVTLGDVNGDGYLDIITSNYYSANVSVLLGNGNGSFQDKQTLTTDTGPISVALGDLNGDGRLDIITANAFSANVSVLLDSTAFTGQRVTVDTAAPAAPSISSITDDAAPITGSIAPGGFTNDTSLDLTGSAEAGSTVSIYDGSTLLGTTTANNTTGAWSYSATDLEGGTTYAFSATATDAAGNISPASSPNYSVTVDTTTPTAPSIISITDDVTPITGTIAPGGITNDTALLLSGTAEAASTVSIYNGSTLLGTANANGTGAWTFNTATLTNASTYAFNATAIDAAGNVSPASSPNYSVTVDTTAPTAPSITSITDNVTPITGTNAPGGITNDTSLLLSGTAEAASTISIYNGSTLLGTATANGTGAWTFNTATLSNGSAYAFNATATDAAGNVSPASSPNYSVTVDTTSPSPTPSGVTSANANGSFGYGSTITLQLSFTETVYVTGKPSLLLETGSTDRTALYKSGSGTNTLSFDYTVQWGDRSADLDIVSSAALSLQGGTIEDAAGNGASLTLPAPGTPGSLGANAALVIDDSAPSAGDSFTTTQGAGSVVNQPVILNQTTDPLGGSVSVTTLLLFDNATTDSNAQAGLQFRVNGNSNNPAATVTSTSDLISFTVLPSVSTSGDVSNLDVNAITTSAVEDFQATIQEVELYFPEAVGVGWSALYKTRRAANNDIEYYLFNYDPLTGLGGMLLDRDNDGSIDGARLYLKDGALGDFDETVNGRIDDPIGFTTLSIAPTLRISTDGKGLTVDGVEGTGLWISLGVAAFSGSSQSNLEMYNNDQPLGAIGATLGSGPTGSQAIYLAAGSTLSFRSSNGAGQVNSNPALSISSTATGFSLGLDADRNGSYTDLMLDISSAIAVSSPASLAIARKQLASSDAILDLTGITATGITLTLDISTDCGLRNRFGFVKLDPLTGTTYQVNGVSQNDGAAFRSAVLSQFLDPYQGTGTSHRNGQSLQSISWTLASNAAGYYAPVMITQGGEVLTFGASTASDGRQHVKLLGTNTFGFEDLLASQGSDWDFNDTKIRVSVSA